MLFDLNQVLENQRAQSTASSGELYFVPISWPVTKCGCFPSSSWCRVNTLQVSELLIIVHLSKLQTELFTELQSITPLQSHCKWQAGHWGQSLLIQGRIWGPVLTSRTLYFRTHKEDSYFVFQNPGSICQACSWQNPRVFAMSVVSIASNTQKSISVCPSSSSTYRPLLLAVEIMRGKYTWILAESLRVGECWMRCVLTARLSSDSPVSGTRVNGQPWDYALLTQLTARLEHDFVNSCNGCINPLSQRCLIKKWLVVGFEYLE